MLILVLSTAIITPLRIAYFEEIEDKASVWAYFSLVSDCICLVDIIFNFRTGVILKHDYNRVIMDPTFVYKRYKRGWFYVDLVSSLPFNDVFVLIFWKKGDKSNALSVVRFLLFTKALTVIKLLRLSRMVRYLAHMEENFFFYSTGAYLRVLNNIGLLLLFGHWHGCLQFLVPRMQNFPDSSWVILQDILNRTWLEQYTWSVYRSVPQMLGSGVGRAEAENTSDSWLMILCMASGHALQALLIGLCCSVILSVNYTKQLNREKIREVEEYMHYQKLPKELQSRIRDYFENRHQGRVFDEARILAALSDPLREAVMQQRFSSVLQVVPFLAHSHMDFIEDLAGKLNHEFFLPRDVIVKLGTVCTKTYFLQSGEARITTDDGVAIATAGPGDHFGEYCLLIRAKANANVIAISHCTLFSLSVDDFNEVLDKHPSMKKVVKIIGAEHTAYSGTTGLLPVVRIRPGSRKEN
ncbi:potassium/sodium hyperpolarization-activated cyclic nucleotide-gated channel 1 [Ixodes scapularis]